MATSRKLSNANKATQDNENLAAVIAIIQRNILLVISIVAVIIATIIVSHTLHNRSETLADQRAQIAALEAKNNTHEDKNRKVFDESMSTATGVELDHKKMDDDTFVSLMHTVLDWKSIAEYEKARQKVLDNWGFSEDSVFMTTFMPGELEGVSRVDAAGNKHYAFDTDISSEFKSAETYVTDVDTASDTYSYVAIVQSNHYSPDGKSVSVGYSLVTYQITGGKDIFNVAAVPTIGRVKTAG